MSGKFKNKYRIDSAHLKHWDYGWNGIYFITICTAKKDCFCGDIITGKMQLSEMGEVARKAWSEIPEHFPYVVLDSYVIMPNHVHGIIAIDKPDNVPRRDAIHRVSNPKNETNTDKKKVESINQSDAINRVSVGGGITGTNNPMLHENLSRIIRWYKGHVAFLARKIHADFGWQARFHEHIIRNQYSMDRINNYVLNNPAMWTDDTFFMDTD